MVRPRVPDPQPIFFHFQDNDQFGQQEQELYQPPAKKRELNTTSQRYGDFTSFEKQQIPVPLPKRLSVGVGERIEQRGERPVRIGEFWSF